MRLSLKSNQSSRSAPTSRSRSGLANFTWCEDTRRKKSKLCEFVRLLVSSLEGESCLQELSNKEKELQIEVLFLNYYSQRNKFVKDRSQAKKN